MGRPQQCADLVRKGMTPCEIARQFGINLQSVIQYLYTAIGIGLIRQSDVLFAIDRKSQGVLEQIMREKENGTIPSVVKAMESRNVRLSSGDVDLYTKLRSARVTAGDLYWFVTQTELILHQLVKEVLISEFGENEDQWWRQGIPQKVRIDCVTLREQDAERPTHPYSYTTLINVVDIIDKNWRLISKRLPRDAVKDKSSFLHRLRELNSIRNRVMHPVRSGPPRSEDLDFVRDVFSMVNREMT